MHNLANQNDIQLRSVRRDDWEWIQKWFRDERLNNELGPIDEAWLEHVLGEKDGVELIAEENGSPVAIIGVLWGTKENPFHVVTDIAVHPKLRRRGIGRRVLTSVLTWPEHPSTSEWIAFISKENNEAVSFLKSLGWVKNGIENLMVRYRFEVL